MIPPLDQRPSDVPDFTEAVPLVFTSRRKAEALPPLAAPEPPNEFGAGDTSPRGAALMIVSALVGLVLLVVGLVLGWQG
jgi:hypothetical protein